MPEICKEISSEIHLTEIDYVEQIKGNSPWTSYFGNLEPEEYTMLTITQIF